MRPPPRQVRGWHGPGAFIHASFKTGLPSSLFSSVLLLVHAFALACPSVVPVPSLSPPLPLSLSVFGAECISDP